MSQTDYIAQQKLLEAIDKLIEGRLNGLPFTAYEQGSIFTVNVDGTYDVKINGEIYPKMKTVNTNTYVKNDVVWIIKINGDSSYKYIFCKF